MPAYERRIIHMELAERTNVTSESVGQEPERKVVVKPYPMAESELSIQD